MRRRDGRELSVERVGSRCRSHFDEACTVDARKIDHRSEPDFARGFSVDGCDQAVCRFIEGRAGPNRQVRTEERFGLKMNGLFEIMTDGSDRHERCHAECDAGKEEHETTTIVTRVAPGQAVDEGVEEGT